jgi:hypothetical protein
VDADDSRRPAIAAIYASLADPEAQLASLLDLHAERTGRNAARHAAKILRGAVQNGRHGIDDTAALRKIAGFSPSKRRQAVGMVARFMAGEGASKRKIAAIAQRLRRKLRNERKMHTNDVCISPGR